MSDTGDNMKKLIYITGAIVIVLVARASFTNKGYFDDKSKTYSNMTREQFIRKEPIEVTLVITYSPDNSLKFDTTADDGDSAFNLLRTVAAKENIEIEIEEYDFGTLIKSIGGRENSLDKTWIYFVNDESANVSADNYIFNKGDTIEYKYIEPIF